ncbi:hypothetical protein ABZ565_10690 [Streptomyces sp. NPDC016469]|uniref:hypothetical protein n=1 Tax=Streptomyces sp. NPDC016469 TaxID=3157191 RepID=UPI0033F6AB8F
MEIELAALAGQAASTLVDGLATAGWERAQQALADLWSRVQPDRAERVAADLTDARADALTARRTGNEALEEGLVAEWAARLERLLAAHPELVPELRRVLDELRPAGAEDAAPRTVTMEVKASGRSRVTMAGRDVTISKG